MILVILKLLVVLFFLVMFIRRPSVAWGIGLLTVTTAALLDTLLGTFNRDELLAELGFFFYVISGVLLAGAAAWFWGVVRPLLAKDMTPASATPIIATTPRMAAPAPVALAPTANVTTHAPEPKLPPPLPPDHVDQYAEAGFDRQMLYEEIRQRFSRADLSDLMFDLNINEADVAASGQSLDELIVRIMDAAELDGNAATVALAVERVLTPPPLEHLPRLEKLSTHSPRTVLRHYLLANYSPEELEQLAADVDIDWGQLDGNDTKSRTRAMLLSLYQRDRIETLLKAMRVDGTKESVD